MIELKTMHAPLLILICFIAACESLNRTPDMLGKEGRESGKTPIKQETNTVLPPPSQPGSNDLTEGEVSSTCQSGATGDYTQPGPYGFSIGIEGSDAFTVIPQDMTTGCKHAVIVFGMGTGAPTSAYQGFYEHLASYGFIVVVDPTKNGHANGESMRRSLDWVYQSEYAPYISDRAGATGHSQGGGGAYATSSHKAIRAIVGLQPGQFLIPSQNTVAAYLGLAGTADLFGPLTHPGTLHYPGSIGVPKFMASYIGADHVASMTQTEQGAGLYYKAVTTAWFRCYLADDQNACAIFSSGTCENLPSADQWTECEGEMLK